MGKEKSSNAYPLRVASTPFASPSLLDRAQNKPDVEGHLRHLMKQRLKEESKSVYIPPQAKASLNASDNARFPLMDKVNDFVASDQKVFLLLGDSGAGKSTFNRALECDLWKAYKKGGPIPLHINLPAIDKPDQDMIAKQLRRSEFTESQIRELKVNRRFILIADGYDESQQTHNLYTTNRLNQPGEWQAKMVISCRSEYLGTDYLDRFQPCDRNMALETTLFQEAVITPFSVDQVDAYINQYVSIHQPLWEAKEYQQALNHIPSLKDLVRNPFLMSLSLEVLPRMMDPGQGLSATRITKVALYDQFVEHWLERGKKRLGEKALSPQARAAFESLTDEGFTKNGIDFLKKLAVAIYKKQDGQPIVEYSRYKDEGSWKADFFSREEEKQLLREACPLTRSGNQHRFIHRSILEYGLTRAVFDPQEYREGAIRQLSSKRRGSTSSVWSFEIRGAIENTAFDNDQGPDINSPLAWRSFMDEPSLLQFLEERVQQEPNFKQQLLDYIEYSKTDKKWRTAAANAITILIRVGVEFGFADLRGIQIPGADLSNGVFESANLQGADLRKANLRNVWLRGADLGKTQMAGVQFGELPFLKDDCEVASCAYSPGGESLAVGLADGTISVYATSNWERSWTTKGHSKNVVGIVYSPQGDLIVSGSDDSTVRLWDVATGVCHHVFTGHSDSVHCLAYSPQGDSVASCSFDKTVRLWDVETGDCRHVLSGHTDRVNVVVYSLKGNTMASCSEDGTVRLWNAITGAYRHTLSGHTQRVTGITFSPQGDLVASASWDTTVRIWEVDSGKCRHILSGSSRIECAIFSPKGNQLASGDWDGTLRLWDVEAGTCIHTLSSRFVVLTVAYSPQGDQVASSGYGNIVQLWDTESGECRHTLTGHVERVNKILYSPKGGHLASASRDGTVRLWNMGAGTTSRVVSSDHTGGVLSIMYSSKRHQIASCSEDRTIRLWDAETGTTLHTLAGHEGHVLNLKYSPQEDRIVSYSSDLTIRLWDVESRTCCHVFSGHSDWVNDVDFSPYGDQVASASLDTTIRLWNVETGACQHVLTGHHSPVNVVAYSPRGYQVASGSQDGVVRLWNVETGECQYALTDHTDDIKSIVYSPSGRQIISGSEDGTARLWDVDTGVCSQVFHHGDRTYISKVVFSPQGNLIASGDWSGKVKLWEVGTGRCRHTLNGHVKRVETIAFSPRGNLIFSSSVDGEARLWDTETGVCRWTHHYDTPRRYREQRKANGVAWIDSDTTEMDAFVTGGRDGSVRMWEVIEEEGGSGSCRVRMRWRSTTGQLTVEDACLKDVQGLSHLNRRLLKQRGAVGEPVLHFRETGKTGLTVGTVGTVSAKSKVVLPKKGQQDTATVSLSAFAPRSARPLGQPMEKWMDAQDRRLSM